MDDRLHMLKQGLALWNIPISPEQTDQFEKYFSILIEWNQKMNITTVTGFEDVMIYHFLDSISAVLTGRIKQKSKIIDVGTGGGFPGVPVKIMRPDIDLVLMDSTARRVVFLEELIEKLHLDSTVALHARAEELAHQPAYREAFDIVFSRAVAELRVLSEYCLPFVKQGGCLIAHKGPGAEVELETAGQAIKALGGGPPLLQKIELLYSKRTHQLVTIIKITSTPKKYPRSQGKPKKSPL